MNDIFSKVFPTLKICKFARGHCQLEYALMSQNVSKVLLDVSKVLLAGAPLGTRLLDCYKSILQNRNQLI